MSVLDAHPEPKPGAYWPPGFKERVEAIARRIAAEDRARAAARLPATQAPTPPAN